MTTDSYELPELPEPSKELVMRGAWGEAAAYARSYARQAVLAERERCARIVDGVCPAASQVDLRKALAAAIRKG